MSDKCRKDVRWKKAEGCYAEVHISWEIFKENPYQNAQQYVALLEGFIGDRLTARNLK